MVTDGAYSDYHLVAIYANEEHAHQHAQMSRSEDCEVREWVVSEEAPIRHDLWYASTPWKNPSEDDIYSHPCPVIGPADMDLSREEYVSYNTAIQLGRDRAVKAVQDRVAQIKAEEIEKQKEREAAAVPQRTVVQETQDERPWLREELLRLAEGLAETNPEAAHMLREWAGP